MVVFKKTSPIQWLANSLTQYSLTNFLAQSIFCSLIPSRTQQLSHSLTHLLIYLFTSSLAFTVVLRNVSEVQKLSLDLKTEKTEFATSSAVATARNIQLSNFIFFASTIERFRSIKSSQNDIFRKQNKEDGNMMIDFASKLFILFHQTVQNLNNWHFFNLLQFWISF